MSRAKHKSTEQRHGNVFGRGSGNMFIHVQRESGLAHRTLTLHPWQVQALRLVTSRWFAAVVTAAVLSWAYFAFQTARVPFLTQRIARLESDAAKIDTLQATLEQVQKRYEQVQQMLSAPMQSGPLGASRITPSMANPATASRQPAAPAPPAANAVGAIGDSSTHKAAPSRKKAAPVADTQKAKAGPIKSKAPVATGPYVEETHDRASSDTRSGAH